MEQSSNGTSSTLKKLSAAEKQQLALIKGSDIYKLFIKAVDIYQKDKAVLTMSTTTSWDNVVRNQGEITGAGFLVWIINYAAKEQEKSIKASKAIEQSEKPAE